MKIILLENSDKQSSSQWKLSRFAAFYCLLIEVEYIPEGSGCESWLSPFTETKSQNVDYALVSTCDSHVDLIGRKSHWISVSPGEDVNSRMYAIRTRKEFP